MHNITVIGSGTMGNGIAHTFAQYGFQVALVDIQQSTLDNAIETISKNLDRQINKGLLTDDLKQETLSRLSTFINIKEGLLDADLVIEAATEDIDTKLSIFKEVDRFCKPGAILASNTSSISITKIASVTQKPENVIGMHFMNPVPVMKLVEIIRGHSTSDEAVSKIMGVSKKLEKTPVESKDYPGFIANRILMPMINEAIYTHYEGVAGISEIDEVMKLGMAHPMGPLELADFIGLDVCLAILRVLYEGFGNPKYAPCPLLINMVNANKLGRKTGEGFYKY
ncbi:MAG TPA: 3-hydroxybutyryl-CoA dehydrogenase [Sphingobacteriaceae bacterium]|nr:3-hydroxybutyryl-CoA dehydrogenase [Sphingobacteriaceae bacterium]